MAAEKPNAKRVCWFNDKKTPNVADLLEKEPDVAMHRLEFDAPDADNWSQLEASHVYCITSARDEVRDQYKVTTDFLKRCPNLLAVSTSGAGYDPIDVDACTEAGVLVINQTGATA
ncbi:MAG: 3-phosphoglycerate dehydrogenase, partial [Pseudomonadota bacterium]